MSKRHSLQDNLLSRQPGLFPTEIAEGSLDIELGFRQNLSRLMHSCGKDRYQIAGEVSRLMRRDLTKDMLDKCVGSDTAYALRVGALPAVCQVVGSLEPFRYLVEPLGADIVNPEDRDLYRLARLEEQRRHLELEINNLRSKCGIR